MGNHEPLDVFGGQGATFETPRIGYPMRFNAPRHNFQQQTPVAEKIKATVKWFDPNKGFGFVAPDDGSPDAFLPASAVTAVGHDRLPEGSTVTVDLVAGQKGNQVSRIYDVDVSTASPRPRRDDAARPAPRMGGAPRPAYGNERPAYGNDRPAYGNNDRGGYGNDRGGYGNDRGGYGNDRGGYGNDRGGYGNDRGGYGGGGYGNDRPSYGGGGYGNDRGSVSSAGAEEVEGTVKWFNTTKGFGFVAPDSGGKDVFVHITAVERSGTGALQENQRVRMKVQQGQKGLEAVSIEAL
ncbi:cold-shock protein [Skermanella stibiiresistens]|uniref:cold-shock protein n=1 Tax=Skermanella stibiiresistens TaxID=913326 RepID=UPI00316AEB59